MEPIWYSLWSPIRESIQKFETFENKKATLDNIESIMRKRKGPAKEKGFETSLSFGPLAARITPRFKTLQEIKNSNVTDKQDIILKFID